METSLAAARCRDGAQLKTFGQLRVGRAGCQTKVAFVVCSTWLLRWGKNHLKMLSVAMAMKQSGCGTVTDCDKEANESE
jgi:hypothetical protein